MAKQPATADSVKFPRPSILLMDLPDIVADQLKQSGYNVTTGSFGTVYRGSSQVVMHSVAGLSNIPLSHTEQDILVVDLAYHLVDSPGLVNIPTGFKSVWTSPVQGIVNPRPYYLKSAKENFDRILQHAGCLIVFTDEVRSVEYLTGTAGQGDTIHQGARCSRKNYDFISMLEENRVRIDNDFGRDMLVQKTAPKPIIDAIEANLHGAHFRCTVRRTPNLSRFDWTPLLTNKFGTTVAAMIRYDSGGYVLLLPQFVNKSKLLQDLLSDALPGLLPGLFPYVTKLNWVHEATYEIPEVVAIEQKLTAFAEEANRKIDGYQQEIEAATQEYGYMHDLITGTGDDLVVTVKKTLEQLGFSEVVDMDVDGGDQTDATNLREDLQIRDTSPLLLVEIKGNSELPKESSSLAVVKYVTKRTRELKRLDIRGLAIINHQRNLPPLERKNLQAFQPDMVTTAEELEFGLLTAWDLYRLLRNFQKYGWRSEDVLPIFYRKGRIQPIPLHYQHLGKIGSYFPEHSVVGVVVEEGQLKSGDRIAFGSPVEYEEQVVESMELDRKAIDVADAGIEVAIKTLLTKEQARKGAQVYKVSRR